MEISTSAGICGSGMKALKNAYLQVAIGEKRNAISVASELGSRIFKSTRYDERHLLAQDGSLPLEAAFLLTCSPTARAPRSSRMHPPHRESVFASTGFR
jgi:acetyl-CoA acetyltransferase